MLMAVGHDRTGGVINIHKSKYIHDMLNRFGVNDWVTAPMLTPRVRAITSRGRRLYKLR